MRWPGADRLTLPYERHDAPRHETGDLNDGEARSAGRVTMTNELRSFASLALSRSALTKAPE